MPRVALFVLACLFSTFAAATPGPGAFDPLFGNAGITVYNFGTNYDYGRQVLIQPDGKYLVAGYGSNVGANLGIGFVARYRRDGGFDSSFNGTGRIVAGDDSVGASIYGAALQPDGKVLAAGSEFLPANGGQVRALLWRFNANGTPDAGFGTNGVVRISGATLPWTIFYSVAVRPDGKLVAFGREYDNTFTDFRGAVYVLRADGQPDTTFGTGGRVSLQGVHAGLRNMKVALTGDGRIVLAGYSANASNAETAVVLRLNADGSPDTGYATGGKYLYTQAGLSTEFDDFVLAADGSLTLVGYAFAGQTRQGFVVRLGPNGAPDAAFGTQGVQLLPAPVALASGIAVQPDGKIVIAGSKLLSDFQALVLRLLPNGQTDTTFGTSGFNQSFGYTRAYGQSIAVDVDGKLVMAGIASSGHDDDTLLARLIGVEITTPVVEFYNSTLVHYFITADPNEAAAIDAGAAGPGWTRTGETFKSGGPNRVCRFYGNPDINPVSGLRRGPNSHFYTIDADECALVKQDNGWRFESYDFNAWPKTGATTCPTGSVPVYRAYNARFTFNDSNHRYTVKQSIYNQMVASGWNGEGVVFCAPS